MNVNGNNATMNVSENATAGDATVAAADQTTHRRGDVDARQNRHSQGRTFAHSVVKLTSREQIIVVTL